MGFRRRGAKVAPDYHVTLFDHHYSVSYVLCGEEVEARLTGATVEIFRRGVRVASHARSYEKYGHTTITEHMPESHRAVFEAGDAITAWAHGVGVGKVQVRVDGGPWNDATLGPDAGIEYWRQWIWTWDSTRGEHELQARVVDTAGKVQDEALANAFPDGSSGLHTIKVTVTG